MRVGSLVYDTWQGLGVLAKGFVDNGLVTDVFVVAHAHHQRQGWYPTADGAGVRDLSQPHVRRRLEEWVRSLDLLLCFETPFDWYLLDHARRAGVPTALMTMHECTPVHLPNRPDSFLCPSLLDLEEFTLWSRDADAPADFARYPTPQAGWGYYAPVPVDLESVPFRPREQCRTFVHNAGWGGLKGRNGTREFLHALQFVTEPINVVLRTQKADADVATMVSVLKAERADVVTIDHRTGTAPLDSLYAEGDVFVFPEKFNGLSLPLQEAFAAGMVVAATARFPNTAYLPPAALIPAAMSKPDRTGPAFREFDSAVINPRDLAAWLDALNGSAVPPDYAAAAEAFRAKMSWEALAPGYAELFGRLVEGGTT